MVPSDGEHRHLGGDRGGSHTDDVATAERRPAIWIGLGVFVAAAIVVAVSPLRTARHGEAPPAVPAKP